MWWWDEKSHRYHDSETGRYISAADVRGYVQDSLDAARMAPAATLEGGVVSTGTDMLANLVGNGLLNPADWEAAMRAEIKREYIRQYLLGIGGEGSMTAQDWGSIGGMIADQYRYLDDFADLVAAGELSEGQIRARAAMYVNSAREAFERAQARAWGIPEGALPAYTDGRTAYPGDGQTICLTNCNCSWVLTDVYDDDGALIGWDCYWTLGPVKTDHCDDCETNASKWNPFEVRL